ncbi:MAG: hypothetical protein H6737_17910 [Alphaproteobacteria bacterium]|nr:hypothetical protein [Alphaproteobacteria bacterium]
MKGYVGLVLLVLGIVVAAAFGARNGDRHVHYRQASAQVAAGQHVSDVLDEGRKLNETLKSEGVDLAALSMEEHLALMEKEPRLRQQVEKTDEAITNLRKWGMTGDDNPLHWLARAKQERAHIGLPEPSERLGAWFSVGGTGWLAGILLIVIGAVLARLQQRDDNAGGAAGTEGRVDFPRALAETRTRVAAIRASIEELKMDEDAPKARNAIDQLGAEVLDPLVEGRGQLIARHGLAGFAEYFGPFSAGERNVNRAWSALTDGHAVVAREALDVALAAFEAAEKGYEAVEARG